MSSRNFYISTDSDGNMPVLTHDKPAKEHYVQYSNDAPIGGHLYDGQDRVWDYNKSQMLAFFAGVKSYDGTDLPVISHFNLW